jgi:hypothetical protein
VRFLSNSCAKRRFCRGETERSIPQPANEPRFLGRFSKAALASNSAYSRVSLMILRYFSRGMILTVAERARALIIGLRYGLSWYFAR